MKISSIIFTGFGQKNTKFFMIVNLMDHSLLYMFHQWLWSYQVNTLILKYHFFVFKDFLKIFAWSINTMNPYFRNKKSALSNKENSTSDNCFAQNSIKLRPITSFQPSFRSVVNIDNIHNFYHFITLIFIEFQYWH